MSIRHLLAVTLVLGALSASAGAQDTAHKPGGLNKVARDVSKTVKKAGRDTKQQVKRSKSDTHLALKKAGNDTKDQAARTTGIHTGNPDPNHKPGGLNAVAHNVSKASKTAGRQAKEGVKSVGGAVHHKAKKTGNAVKDEAKEAKKP